MSDLKRFALKFDSMSDCYCDVEADENGDYVLFEDVPLLQTLERLAREYGKLKRNSIEESRNDKGRIEELEAALRQIANTCTSSDWAGSNENNPEPLKSIARAALKEDSYE